MLAGQSGLLGFDLRQGVGDRVQDRGPVKPQPAASHRPKLGERGNQDRRRAAAHQRSGQLDFGQPSKVRATARPGAALRRDMEDMVRRLAGAAGGQWR